jgi:hypothetical protein
MPGFKIGLPQPSKWTNCKAIKRVGFVPGAALIKVFQMAGFGALPSCELSRPVSMSFIRFENIDITTGSRNGFVRLFIFCPKNIGANSNFRLKYAT